MSDTNLTTETASLWESDAESKLLESRLAGFWNTDYFTRILLPLLDLKPGSRVLDVGAGNGSLTLLLARYLPQVHFVGVDITAKIVGEAQALAQSMGITNVEFQEGDALQLPFEDSSFDATVCQTLLIHLSNAKRAIQEMSRVLKKGGTFMAAEYHTLFGDTPIDAQRTTVEGEEGMQIARYTQMLIDGYRKGGHGDLKAGGKVPFMALQAGLQIKDIRINDRVAHAFPPYSKPNEQAALTEALSWTGVFQDPSYRSWLSANLVAAGGSESDVDRFLELVVTPGQREAFAKGAEANYAFLWLINPVLLVVIAKKP